MPKFHKKSFDEEVVLEWLRSAWSAESSSLYSEENPARGHCGVTALVVQDHFGGEIRKTPTEEGDHFYNYINGTRHDLTVSQFNYVPTYLDIPVERAEAFADTNEEQYAALTKRFLTAAADE